MLEALIELSDVGKTFWTQDGKQIQALKNVTFQVRKNEFVCIIGPSGCGKTSLLKLIAGIYPPTRGEVRVHGTSAEEAKARREFGFIFQDPVLLPWRTVLENSRLLIEVVNRSRTVPVNRTLDLLKLAGLDGFAHKYPFELSGGMRQRVAIVRALSLDPAILLMDEPFSSLDEITREQMNLDLLRIWERRSTTICFVTHNIPEAVFLSDRILVLSARPGRVAEIVEVPLSRPRHIYIKETERFIQVVKRIRQIIDASSWG